jgi:hypothetical protein
MASLLRNLRIVLGVDLDEKGLKKADRALAAIDVKLGKIGRAAAAGVGLAALSGSAVALTGALLPAAGAIVALPAAMATAKVATATLKVGMIGLGDAMTAVAQGDAAALDKSLAKLSPQARKFVREAAGFKGAFDPIQQAVQNRMFEGLGEQLRPVGANLLPTTRAGMLGVAEATNDGAKAALRFAATPLARGAVGETLSGTTRIMGRFSGAVRPALELLTQLTVKSLPLAERMSQWTVNGIKSASAFTTSARGAAALERTVDKAGDSLGQLGRITGNVGGGAVAIFGQMEDSGDGVLDTVERLTERFETWARSAGGQERIAEALGLVRDVAADIGDVLPLLTGPLGLIASILTSLPGPLRDVVTQGLALALVVGPLAGKMGALTSGVLHIAAATRDADSPLGRMRDRLGEIASQAGGGRTGASGKLAGMAGLLAAGGPWGLAIAGGVVALGLFASSSADAERQVGDLTAALKRNKGALDESAISGVKDALVKEGAYKAAERLGVSLRDVTDAALGHPAALGRVTEALDAYELQVRQATPWTEAYDAAIAEATVDSRLLRGALGGQNERLAQAREEYRLATAASGGLVESSVTAASAIDDVGTSAGSAKTKVEALATALGKFNSMAGDSDSAAIAFHESLDALSTGLKKNNLAIDQRTGKFDLNSKAGRENNKLIIDAARNAAEHAAKVYEETNSVGKANKAFNTHIDRLRGVLNQSGLSKKAIDKLIERYISTPASINAALDKIKNRTVTIKAKADGTVFSYRVTGGGQGLTSSGGARASIYADGGIMPGFSPGRDVHRFVSPTGGQLMLSGGESVMRPEWTRAVGAAYVNRMNAAARAGGTAAVVKALGIAGDPGGLGIAGYANGGIIARNVFGSLAPIRAMAAATDQIYGRWANTMGKQITQWANELWGGGAGRRAVQAVRSQIGVPYSWGGGGPGGPSYGFGRGAGTVGFDCSSLMQYGWFKGSGKVIPRTTYTQIPWVKRIPGPRPGALGFPHSGHVFMATERGTIVEAPFTGARVREVPRRSATWGMPPFAYDQGGILQPGFTPVYNGTQEPEYVFTQRQMEHGVGGQVVIERLEVKFADDRNLYQKGQEFAAGLREYARRGGKVPISAG